MATVNVTLSGGELGGQGIEVDLEVTPLMGIVNLDVPDENGGVRYHYRIEQVITYQGVYTGLESPIPEE